MFPFGVGPESGDDAAETGRDDVRGPDTANRLLLHGARHHDRDAVFLEWGQGRKGWGWQATPDWRADRAAIRAALVLRQRARVAEGERVAIWLPLGPRWVEVERAVWSIGAVSVPVWPEWGLERVTAVLAESGPEVLFAPSLEAVRELEALGGRPEGLAAIVCLEAPEEQGEDWLSFPKFMEYGGILDTAERASMWRTFARRVEPAMPAALEYGEAPEGVPGETAAGRPRQVDHGELVVWAERVTRRLRPRRGGVRLLATARPDLLSRTLAVAGWADGLTRTAFAPSPAARERAAELAVDVDVVACPAYAAGGLVEALAVGDAADGWSGSNGAERAGPVGRLSRWLRGAAKGRGGRDGADAPVPVPWVVATDGAPVAAGGTTVPAERLVDGPELLREPSRSLEDDA